MFTESNPEILLIKGVYSYKKTGKKVNQRMCDKIKKIGIPPAYKNFWISKSSTSNIQAISLDSKNRKQYFYHSDWINKQTNKKYIRMYKFMKQMPIFWKKIDRDFKYASVSVNKMSDFPKKKVMAGMFKIMKHTNIRIGNKKYFDDNNSVGLTTLKKKNIKFGNSNKILLKFKGKSGVDHVLTLNNKNLFIFLKEQTKIPTEWLMQYKNHKGNFVRITSIDMNKYLQSIIGKDFTCKDFRTHAANINFLKHLQCIKINENPTKGTLLKNISQSLESTAKELGHNKSTSKNSYVNEKLIDEYVKNSKGIIHGNIEKILLKVYKT
jgi:DNA topoisomerase-1